MATDSVLRRLLCLLVVSASLAAVQMNSAAPALAGCGQGPGGDHPQVQGATDAGTLVVGVETEVQGDSCGGVEPTQFNGPRDSGLDALCVREALSQGLDPFAFCDLAPVLGSPIQLTPGMVATAFRNIPLPPSELTVQPPNGRTLVNFATNFYTEQGPFNRTVRLLGQRVELRIWPSEYRWVFGDGAGLASESAGAPYPELLVTHSYRRAGSVSPRVDTTYAAQFSVNGGPWRDVDGTVTIPGSPVGLDVTTAGPVLVGYH